MADAVRSCLAQAGGGVEVVVVDDGSNDGTTPQACDALQGPHVTVVHQANAGLPAARNAGAALARADRLVFLDADDWIEPAFVNALSEALDADAHASHAYCHERLTDLGQGVVWHVPQWDPILLLVTNLHPVTSLIRRQRFEAVGGFDATMTRGYEDWDLWLRFATRGWHGVRVPQVLFNWRRHSRQTMIDDAAARHGELYRQLLENHRAYFDANALEAAVRANDLLRRADAHWVDDTGVPIETQYLRAVRDAYHASPAVALERCLPGLLRRALARIMRRRRPNTITHPTSQRTP